ncbi:MAG: TIGR04063 family PEP-CTERM/XrtA system glycosyltransferase [Betaproteobacteria bacterium]
MTFRILHVLDHSIPMQSGYTFRTRAILREQRRMGWETFHLTSPKHTAPGAAQEDVDGLHFYRTAPVAGRASGIPGMREFALMRALARRLAEVARITRPDVLHAHSPVLNALPALWVGRRLKIPVIYEVRAFWEDAAVDLGTSREGGLRYRLSRAMETFAFRRVAHITTICDGLKRDIVARGIPEHRVTIIPNAVDVAAFEFGQAADLALKEQLGLAGKTVVGFIGSFYAYEGLDLLLAALPAINARMSDVRVLLVGGGPKEAALKALAKSLNLGDRVVFAGRVSHAEVHRYYSIVDVFAYPRHSMRLTELVTPLKPLEAMAQGRLLVASDVGGHRELIHHGETGMLFRAGDATSLADAILTLLERRDLWPRLREQGRRFVEEERNWEKSVAGYRSVFETIGLATA